LVDRKVGKRDLSLVVLTAVLKELWRVGVMESWRVERKAAWMV
jgi:hypothetical protein